MKKRIYLILLSVVVIFFSCRDESGKFEKQLFTDEQISSALKECIRATSDSTLNALCIVDTLNEKQGYYYYDSKAYRIELPTAAKQVIDTLTAYGFGDALDSLIFNINRAAEQCGNKIKSDFLEPLIKNIIFPNPNQTLHGGNSAITDYVKATKQTDFVNMLKTYTLNEQFKALNLFNTWNMLLDEYRKITGTFTSIDILAPSVQQMVDGFFKEMALWEKKVRDNPELGGDKKGWLYQVFITLQ
jgi:hypothetical protein